MQRIANECYAERIRRRLGYFVALAVMASNASGAPNPTVPPTGTRDSVAAAAAFTPSSIPPVVERSDWEIAAFEPPGRVAVPSTVQGLLWASGLAERSGPANSGTTPANLPREGNYVFSFDGQVGEPVAFVARDGQSTFVGKGRGERGGDLEKLKSLRPGAANDWRLTAAAHIVELEVSRRRGRPPLPPGSTSSLIVSKVRVLDERAFAGSPAEVVRWAARDFEAMVREKGQGTLFDSLYQLSVHPTWFAGRKQFVVRLVLRSMGPEPRPLQCAPCIRGRACACGYLGVALAGEYLLDARSRLLRRTYYPPRPQNLTVLDGRIL